MRTLAALFPTLAIALIAVGCVPLNSDRPPTWPDDPIGEGGRKQAYDDEPRLAILFSDSQRFGISCLRLHDPQYPEKPKLLTRDERGHTNNTCVRIEGHEYLFGIPLPGVHWAKEKGRVQKEVKSKDKRKTTSIMDYDNERIRVTQSVELIVSEGTRLYDTALVKYIVENRDDKAHTVGLRFLLDTLIGLEDGVPFFIPPTNDAPARLVETMEIFERAQVPVFVRAMENTDFEDKNTTVAELNFRLRGFEPPSKVVICRWPQEHGASEARWQWPFQAMNEPKGSFRDSCVVIYWDKQTMQPGEKRVLGFTYGLGRLASDDSDSTRTCPGAKMKLFAGPARAKRGFAITAYVKDGDGQNVKLKLPPGLELRPGQTATKPVKRQPGAPYAQVTWGIQAEKAGDYQVEAVLDDGGIAKAKAVVLDSGRGIFD